jgi:hypothetical protein
MYKGLRLSYCPSPILHTLFPVSQLQCQYTMSKPDLLPKIPPPYDTHTLFEWRSGSDTAPLACGIGRVGAPEEMRSVGGRVSGSMFDTSSMHRVFIHLSNKQLRALSTYHGVL